MVHIPSNIQELKSYQPGKPITQLVKELGLSQWAVLWNNENNLGPSSAVKDAIAASAESLHLYPDPTSSALRHRIAAINQCDPNQVVVDNGSESLLDNLFRSFFEDGDELLTCEGTFVAIYIWAKSNNRALKKESLNRSYGFDLKSLVENINSNTKAVYIANPNNPTGTIVSEDELVEALAIIPKDVLVVIDEAYFSYAKALSPSYPDSFKLRASNVVTLRTFSKAYGIAGARIGYALGPSKLIEAMSKVKMTFAPSALSQAAALAAINDDTHLKKVVDLNTEGLQMISNALHDAEIDYVPSYANFVMADLKTEETAVNFTADLMKAGVFIRHLKAFGLPHCVRISTGTAAENELFVKILQEQKS